MYKAISISAVSGTGKATICMHLKTLAPYLFAVTSSGTTRKSKVEVHGKKYEHFSHDDFEALIKGDGFLEHNKYPTKNDFNYYGSLRTSYEEIVNSGKIALFDVDINGATQLKQKLGNDLFSIFLNCEIEETESRLRKRNSEDEEQIQIRLKMGRLELEQIPTLKTRGVIDEIIWYGKDVIPGIIANEILNFILKKQTLV